MTFSYQAYGIAISSAIGVAGLDRLEIVLPNSLSFESGPAPEWVRANLELPARVIARRGSEYGGDIVRLTEHGEQDCFELRYEDGAVFVVSGRADRVWGSVQPPFNEEDLATYFLGPVMGFVLRRRYVTCLHASGVELHGQGVVFCGDAGYGKSTTAGALALRGFPVIAEDIMPLEFTSTGIQVIPGYPRVCLWPDAVESLVGEPEGLPRLTPTWGKRFLPLDGVHGQFVGEKKPLGLIYVFGDRRDEASAPRIEELAPQQALIELVKKTYMNWQLDKQRRAREFEELAQVVEKIPVRRIVAHQSAEKIGALCELIVSDAAKNLSGVKV